VGRIRTIKPEFPQSESVGRLSRDGRLLFLMLFTIVDDEGRARAAPRMLASLLYPYDDDAKTHIVQWLFELEREGCIKLYEVEGNAYLQIEKWLEHQKIDRPSPSRLPSPSLDTREKSPNPREPSATDLVPSILDHGPRTKEGIGEAPARKRASPPVSEPEGFAEFWQAYPNSKARPDALKAYRQVIARGADHAAIMAGTRRYASEVRGEEKKFIKHAGGWLRDERWRDSEGATVIRPTAFTSPEEQEAQRLMREKAYGSVQI
jgi:hypothetical protein